MSNYIKMRHRLSSPTLNVAQSIGFGLQMFSCRNILKSKISTFEMLLVPLETTCSVSHVFN